MIVDFGTPLTVTTVFSPFKTKRLMGNLFDIYHISNFLVWLMDIIYGFVSSATRKTETKKNVVSTKSKILSMASQMSFSAGVSVFKKLILILFWDPMTTKVWPSIHWNLYVWLKISWSTNKWSFLVYMFRKADKTSARRQKRQLRIVCTFV